MVNVPRFRANEHIRRSADFQAAYDRRRSAADGTLIIYARENGLGYSRLGLSVSRKFGGAVQRNRIRRLMREAYRLTKEAVPVGYDYVLIPRPAEMYTLDAFQTSIKKLTSQAVRKILRDSQSITPTPSVESPP